MLGISANEFIVLLAVAAIVLGPERLPRYTQQLTRLIRELRRMAQGATEQVRAELGPEFDDVDWRKLDPRQYDPRRIVREALADTFDPDDPLGLKQPRRAAGRRSPTAEHLPEATPGRPPPVRAGHRTGADRRGADATVRFDPDAI